MLIIKIPINDGLWDGWEVVDVYCGVSGGEGGEYHHKYFFCCAFVFVLSCSQSLYLGGYSMMTVVSVFFVFILFSLSVSL